MSERFRPHLSSGRPAALGHKGQVHMQVVKRHHFKGPGSALEL
jgi:hypothetical protein